MRVELYVLSISMMLRQGSSKKVFVGRDYRQIGGNIESKPHKFRERSDKYESIFNHVSQIELCVSIEAPQDNHILLKHKSGQEHKVEFSGAYG